MKTFAYSLIKKLFPEKTEIQLWEELKKLHLHFSAYMRYQHTDAGFYAAIQERNYSREVIEKIWKMPSGQNRLNAIKMHIQYLKIINCRGPQ